MCTSRLLRSTAACLALVATAAACGDDGGTAPPATRTYTVAIQAGDTQLARNGTVLPIQPTILVSDEHGDPAPGIGVTFAVAAGHGTVTAPPQTDANGLAAAAWTLGWLRGNDTLVTQQLRATVTGTDVVGDTVTFLSLATGNRWDSVPIWWTARMSLAIGGVLNNKLYVLNGYSSTAYYVTATVFDPATGRLSSATAMPSQVWDAASAVLNNRLYVAGGKVFVDGQPTRGLQVYDGGTNQWATRAQMARARTGARGAAVGGKVYVMGGVDSSGAPLADVEAYDTATNAWTTLAPMPTARVHMGTAVLDGKIWVVGGLDAQPAPLATVEIYDPATNTWTTGTPLSVARQGPVVVELSGKVYAISGDAAAGTMPTVEAWDPAASAWIARHDFRWHAWNSLGGVIGGKIYTFGGDDGTTWIAHFGVYTP